MYTQQQANQPPLFSSLSCKVPDQARYAAEMAHAQGITAAFGADPDNRIGTVKITLDVENDDMTVRLIQNLVAGGWTRTGTGAEWIVSLPLDLFDRDAFAPAHAYALAFKDVIRRTMMGYQLFFKVNTKYTFV